MVNMANLVTLGRLAAAVAFFVLVSFDAPIVLDAALVVFIAACLTDLLDGYLARKYDQVTALGRIADPLVDKVIVCGGLVLLANRVPPGAASAVAVILPWMVVVIISREFLVSSIRGYAESRGVAFGAKTAGKVKTATQMLALCFVIYYIAHGDILGLPAGLSRWVTLSLVYLAVVLTVLSAIAYITGARRTFAPGGQKND